MLDLSNACHVHAWGCTPGIMASMHSTLHGLWLTSLAFEVTTFERVGVIVVRSLPTSCFYIEPGRGH